MQCLRSVGKEVFGETMARSVVQPAYFRCWVNQQHNQETERLKDEVGHKKWTNEGERREPGIFGGLN